MLAVVLLAGCSLPKMIKTVEEINLDVTPSPVVLQGDDVTIDITGKFPPKYFAKKVTVAATPCWCGTAVKPPLKPPTTRAKTPPATAPS